MLSGQLLAALKSEMKRKGISYKEAGERLELSESSVKRLFAEKSFTLLRLEKLCDLAQTDIGELVRIAESTKIQTRSLSREQEKEIVNNPKLLLAGICVINRYSFEDILEKYQIKETELIGLFTKLDRLKIIELLPENRYRLTISPDFNWQPGGPIQKFFIGLILNEYLVRDMQQSDTHLHFVWGMLSKETAKEFAIKVQRLIDDYVLQTSSEARLPRKEKLTSSLFVMFREDWAPSLFKAHWQHQHGLKKS